MSEEPTCKENSEELPMSKLLESSIKPNVKNKSKTNPSKVDDKKTPDVSRYFSDNSQIERISGVTSEVHEQDL